MSDLAQAAITEADVQQFFAERAQNWKCEVCGRSDWGLGDLHTKYETLGIADKGSMQLGPHVPLVLLVCNNCAHIRLFARNIIVKWKAERGGNG